MVLKQLNHDFLLISPLDIPLEIRYSLLDNSKVQKKIIISDKFILKNACYLSSKFVTFKSYWFTIGNVKNGLSYYGTTIFETEMIPEFLYHLKKIDDCDEKTKLIELCECAIKNDSFIIHFGV